MEVETPFFGEVPGAINNVPCDYYHTVLKRYVDIANNMHLMHVSDSIIVQFQPLYTLCIIALAGQPGFLSSASCQSTVHFSIGYWACRSLSLSFPFTTRATTATRYQSSPVFSHHFLLYFHLIYSARRARSTRGSEKWAA